MRRHHVRTENVLTFGVLKSPDSTEARLFSDEAGSKNESGRWSNRPDKITLISKPTVWHNVQFSIKVLDVSMDHLQACIAQQDDVERDIEQTI
jgi:DNA primase